MTSSATPTDPRCEPGVRAPAHSAADQPRGCDPVSDPSASVVSPVTGELQGALCGTAGRRRGTAPEAAGPRPQGSAQAPGPTLEPFSASPAAGPGREVGFSAVRTRRGQPAAQNHCARALRPAALFPLLPAAPLSLPLTLGMLGESAGNVATWLVGRASWGLSALCPGTRVSGAECRFLTPFSGCSAPGAVPASRPLQEGPRTRGSGTHNHGWCPSHLTRYIVLCSDTVFVGDESSSRFRDRAVRPMRGVCRTRPAPPLSCSRGWGSPGVSRVWGRRQTWGRCCEAVAAVRGSQERQPASDSIFVLCVPTARPEFLLGAKDLGGREGPDGLLYCIWGSGTLVAHVCLQLRSGPGLGRAAPPHFYFCLALRRSRILVDWQSVFRIEGISRIRAFLEPGLARFGRKELRGPWWRGEGFSRLSGPLSQALGLPLSASRAGPGTAPHASAECTSCRFSPCRFWEEEGRLARRACVARFPRTKPRGVLTSSARVHRPGVQAPCGWAPADPGRAPVLLTSSRWVLLGRGRAGVAHGSHRGPEWESC